MSEDEAEQIIDLGNAGVDEFNDHALAQGWGDGLPLVPPTEDKVAAMLAGYDGADSFAAMPPRHVFPTLKTIAANAVMAGCRPEYFPVVVAAVRAVLQPAYNLHGALATTHPCTNMIIVSGPVRQQIGLNCGANCMGQFRRANVTIGRALQLVTLNIGGARPGETDRATQGSPAKIAFCFGENQEESPWAPYHVRRGFDAGDSVVTCIASEGPHNINDHGSTTGEGILMTVAGTITEAGANTIYRHGPYTVAFGPEHAATLKRDGWSIEAIQEKLFEDSAIHMSRFSKDNQKHYAERKQVPVRDKYYLTPGPADIQILVAGGSGKHSCYIPTFGYVSACSERI